MSDIPDNTEDTFRAAALKTFRAHADQHYLRLHHAIYLHYVLHGLDWKYEDLNDSMRSTLNRFFELVDRAALSTCQIDSWREDEFENILKRGEQWVKHLRKEKPLLLTYGWGSVATSKLWESLVDQLGSNHDTPVSRLGGEDYTKDEEGPQYPYEIFSGGFEYVPTIGLFPFYLFGERLSTWGIIRYGTLRSLVLVASDPTLALIRKRIKVDSNGSQFSISEESFIKLIEELLDSHITIYYLGPGHAALTLTPRIVGLSRYRQLRSSIRPMDVKSKKIATVIGEPRSVILSDPGDELVNTYLANDDIDPAMRRVIRVRGLNVPVGFGYSLALLPHLLREKKNCYGNSSDNSKVGHWAERRSAKRN